VKKDRLLKLVVGVVLIVVLVVSIPLMAGCRQAPPEVAPPTPEVAPSEEVAPPEEKVITAKIAVCSALSGPSSGWVLPGYQGMLIWAEHLNADGGIELADGTRVMAEIVGYDTEYIGEKCAAGTRMLIEEGAVVLNYLGGGPDMPGMLVCTDEQMLSFTSCTPDSSPETPYLLFPAEAFPLTCPGSFEYFVEQHPEVETMAVVGQNDMIHISSLSVMEAVFEGTGVEIIYNKLYDLETVDFAPIVSDAIASGADGFSWGTSYPDFTTLIVEQLYLQGWDGPMMGGVFDFYDEVAERTSYEYLEGIVWAYPDWDSPLLNPSPNPYTTIEPIDFWNEYNARYPGSWTANTWEYPARLEVWKQGVIFANSIEPMEVMKAMKEAPIIYHVYGEGRWMGKELRGVDNLLLADYPVVEFKDGHATCPKLWNRPDWYDQHWELLLEKYEKYDQAWYQLMGLSKEKAMEQYPDAFDF